MRVPPPPTQAPPKPVICRDPKVKCPREWITFDDREILDEDFLQPCQKYTTCKTCVSIIHFCIEEKVFAATMFNQNLFSRTGKP